MGLHIKKYVTSVWFSFSKSLYYQQVLSTYMGALFALLLLVKKHSAEKSSSCIGGTRLRFTVSEVNIAVIVWFVNMAIVLLTICATG